MQAIWLFLLDEEFMHAYEHGIVVQFADNVKRRVFPRFFTYAADYPEKQVFCLRYFAMKLIKRLQDSSRMHQISGKISLSTLPHP
jgi:hypothetical protein